MAPPIITADQLALLPALYDAAICDDKWDDALDIFVRCVGAKSTMLFAFEHEVRRYGLSKFGGVWRGEETGAEEYYRKYKKYEDEAMAVFAKSEPRTLLRDVDVWPDIDALRRRGDFQMMRDRWGVFRRLGTRLNGSPAWFDGCTILYGDDLEEIPAANQVLIASLLPSLAKVVELNRFFHILQTKYRAALAVLDRVKIGVCIADTRGHIVIANSEADRIFALHDGLARSGNDQIRCAHEPDTAAIQAAIEAAAHTACGQNTSDEALFAIERRSGSKPYLIEVTPLRDSLQEIESSFAGAMVSIIDPENSRPFSTENVAKLYGLTAAEGEVCRLLVDGLTNEDIAETRSVSVDTIKNQVKSIYRKLGVAGRADLVREVLTVNPPID